MRLIKGPDAGKTGHLVSAARHRMIINIDGEPVPAAVSPGWVQLTEPDEVARFTTPADTDTGVLAVLAAWLLTPTGTFTRSQATRNLLENDALYGGSGLTNPEVMRQARR